DRRRHKRADEEYSEGYSIRRVRQGMDEGSRERHASVQAAQGSRQEASHRNRRRPVALDDAVDEEKSRDRRGRIESREKRAFRCHSESGGSWDKLLVPALAGLGM